MKKLFYLLTLLLASNLSIAQTLSQLDTKNGFKDFKLGDPISKYYGQLNSINENKGLYEYSGRCCRDLFGFAVELIALRFTNNQLSQIVVTTPKDQGDQVDKNNPMYLDSRFEMLFGKPSAFHSDDQTGNLTSQWQANNVLLTVEYLYEGYKSGWHARVIVESTQLLKSGF